MKKSIFIICSALLVAAISLTQFSCKKDSTVLCTSTTCLNGGTCNNGTCTCARLYEGPNCANGVNVKYAGTYTGTLTTLSSGASTTDTNYQVIVTADPTIPIDISIASSNGGTSFGSGFVVASSNPSFTIAETQGGGAVSWTGSGSLNGNNLSFSSTQNLTTYSHTTTWTFSGKK